MEALKVAVQPLEDEGKKESPFSKEKGDFVFERWIVAKITSNQDLRISWFGLYKNA